MYYTVDDTVKNLKENSQIFDVCQCCDLIKNIKKYLRKNFVTTSKAKNRIYIRKYILYRHKSIGTIMVESGVLINIIGKFTLKGNLANQIKIYFDHKLIEKSIYKFIRHPLCAWIVQMMFGGVRFI